MLTRTQKKSKANYDLMHLMSMKKLRTSQDQPTENAEEKIFISNLVF